jgi:hypothetical protein
VNQDDRGAAAQHVEGDLALIQARAPAETPAAGELPAQNSPTISPFSSMSIPSAAGEALRPGIVLMSPQMG